MYKLTIEFQDGSKRVFDNLKLSKVFSIIKSANQWNSIKSVTFKDDQIKLPVDNGK